MDQDDYSVSWSDNMIAFVHSNIVLALFNASSVSSFFLPNHRVRFRFFVLLLRSSANHLIGINSGILNWFR